jgi:hypothetical protein
MRNPAAALDQPSSVPRSINPGHYRYFVSYLGRGLFTVSLGSAVLLLPGPVNTGADIAAIEGWLTQNGRYRGICILALSVLHDPTGA